MKSVKIPSEIEWKMLGLGQECSSEMQHDVCASSTKAKIYLLMELTGRGNTYS